MSTEGHLLFKNILLFLQKQNIEVGMWHSYHLSHGRRLQWSAD